jgi:small neutral amino acid transporter SnatA (MarC family)
MTKENPLRIVGSIMIIVIGFILGGSGLAILYNSKGDTASIVGGFTLIGIAVAVIYKLIQNE